MTAPKIHLHKNDLPAGLDLGKEIAIDTETKGLHLIRDRLCLVQLRGRDTDIHLVQISKNQKDAPNLKKMLEDKSVLKIFHFGRFDIAKLKQGLGITLKNVFCTKICSKLVRTYSDRHGLKELVREVVGIDISKQQQLTDWGKEELSSDQQDYAASDVLYLHTIMDKMIELLKQEDRYELAKDCFTFLPARAELDLLGWEETDIFAHS